MDRNCRIWNKSKLLPIGGDAHDDRYAPRGIAFVDDLVEMLGFHSLARAAFDGAINIIVRHALGAGGKDRAPEPGVAVGVASARLRRDRDFAGKLAEERAAFGVERSFEPFNLGPLAVSRHAMGIL